ncbi:MAG TPA: hypothetical protein VFB37_00105 [Steroidobacteraceae bacterium]|nr:hypothetical protein [Steroidobacteraceae bacterium]
MKTTAPQLFRRTLELVTIGALLAVLTLPGTARAASEPWPEIPMPPKADVQWIATSMRVNGIPTRIMRFQSHVSRAEIISYYRAYWTGAYEHKPSISALGDATVVGQTHGPYLMTVKVEDAPKSGSHGLISVALVIGSKLDHDPGQLPMLPGAHVISVVESDDPGKHSRQLLILAPQAPTSALEFYSDSLLNSGWAQVQSTEARQGAGPAGGVFVAFAHDDSEMQLSIVGTARGRGTTILANLVTKDTGRDGD